MTKNNIKNNIEPKNKNEFLLPLCGKKVSIDAKKADGHLLLEARKATEDGNLSVGIFILSEISTFDGEKLTAFDILDMDMEDVVALEDEYIKLKKSSSLTSKA